MSVKPDYESFRLAPTAAEWVRGRRVQRPKVLAASPEFALGPVLRALGNEVRIVHVQSLSEARDALRTGDFRLVICGIHFDEPRVFELIREARESPGIPVICARLLDGIMPRVALEALEKAALGEGACAFVDWPKLVSRLGQAAARERFAAIAKHCIAGSERQAG